MSRRLRLILVGLFFAQQLAFVGVNAYQVLALVRSDWGWDASWLNGHAVISQVRPSEAASPLRPGDEIVKLNGQPFIINFPGQSVEEHFQQVAPGTPYSITIQRQGQLQTFTLDTAPTPRRLSVSRLMIALVIPGFFLLMGSTMFILKPDDKLVLLFALMLGTGTPYGGVLFFFLEGLPGWLAAVKSVGFVLTIFPFALFCHFFLLFPDPKEALPSWRQRFPQLEYWLYLPALLLVPLRVWEIFTQASWPIPVILAVFILYLIVGLAALLLNYQRASSLSRRKMRVAVTGSVIALLPVLLAFTTTLLSNVMTVNWAVAQVAEHAWLFTIWLFPVSFAYAIIRHQVLPVSLIIRRGVQYLLAKNALRLILVLPIIGVIYAVISHPNLTLKELLIYLFYEHPYYPLMTAVAALSLVFCHRLSDWIDRQFFREAYQQEKILRALTDDIKQLDSISEMSKRVSAQAEAALHPERIYLFYRGDEQGDLSLGYSSSGQSPNLSIPSDFRLLRFMEDQGGAQDFPFPKKNNLPSNEKDWLTNLGISLIVPMSSTDSRLVGLLLLGPKKSEVPYTAEDRELLETLAGQIAMVYENAWLKRQVDKGTKIQREVLSRLEGEQINLLKECPICGVCYDSAAQFCTKDGGGLTLSLPVERTIDGKYRLQRLLGKGGMGAVYQATDLRLSREIAIKLITGSKFGDQTALRRFEREARASAKLSHPNIIAIHDYGRTGADGAYLVMELVAGLTLRAEMRRMGKLPPRLTAEWFDQILEGMKVAHQAGVIHRDLKPENILIASQAEHQAQVKILDFGLAKLKLLDPADSNSLTMPGMVMGTLSYMSPEQLAGEEVDERSDIFSLGVMIVEALTGSRPFSGRTHVEILTAVLHQPYHLSDSAPEVVALDAVLQRCLAKDRSDRFSTIAEMQRALIPAIIQCPPLVTFETVSDDDTTTSLPTS